ncbi:hypothetical protein R6Q57_018606 [Mikania cordata]
MSPSQQLELVLGRIWLYERKLAVEKSLSLPVPGHRCVHRRGNRNASCSAGVAWSESVAGVRILATPWHDTFRSSIPLARPDAAPFLIIIYRPFFPPRYSRMKIIVCMLEFGCRCYSIGRSTLWQDPSPGQTNPPPRRIVLCPPDPYRAKELPGDP